MQLLKFADQEMKTTGGTVDVQVEFEKALQLPGNDKVFVKAFALPACINDQPKATSSGNIDPR